MRIATLADLDEDRRAATYYRGLLVNVGCHSGARAKPAGSATTSPSKATETGARPDDLGRGRPMPRLLGSGRTPVAPAAGGLRLRVGPAATRWTA